MKDPAYQILLYYYYVEIKDSAAFAKGHRTLCERLDLRGRILVAREGINGTVSGGLAETREYMKVVHRDDRFRKMPFKIDPAEGHVFPKLSIKVRSEVVTLGLGEEEDVDPNAVTGEKLQPSEWQEMLETLM